MSGHSTNVRIVNIEWHTFFIHFEFLLIIHPGQIDQTFHKTFIKIYILSFLHVVSWWLNRTRGGTWLTNIRGRAAGKSKKLPCPGVKFPKMIPCPGVKFSQTIPCPLVSLDKVVLCKEICTTSIEKCGNIAI